MIYKWGCVLCLIQMIGLRVSKQKQWARIDADQMDGCDTMQDFQCKLVVEAHLSQGWVLRAIYKHITFFETSSYVNSLRP